MNATLKEREVSKEKSTIYLHTFYRGKRKRISLGLTIYKNPKNAKEKRENRSNYELAERKRAEALLELQDNAMNINRKDFSRENFVEYFRLKGEERKKSKGNYGNWDASLKHFENRFGKRVPMRDITLELANDFKDYLENEAETKSERPLSQNSRHTYYNKFKACLRQAYIDQKIKVNVADRIKGFKQGEVNREYLTMEELRKLAKAKCRYPILKKAFLFSCFTGMRWSDINKLKWENIRCSEARGNEVVFTQKKTGGHEHLPINDSALSFLPKRTQPKERVFKGLKYSAYHNLALFKWVLNAGIDKHITFHCARHTNAVLLLENGADIYTVSKLLGHKSISTTQVYAKIVDSKKLEAVNSIPAI